MTTNNPTTGMIPEKPEPSKKTDKSDRQAAPSRQMGSRLTNASAIESVIPNYRENLKGMFAFSYIWAFGGNLHDR